ncbi:MAG: hypothetical protein SWE60_12610 [Thermodesulfobacteriota bacterium]|nr:hypothetical protein [Thermodesulfobacteriota bacterium]
MSVADTSISPPLSCPHFNTKAGILLNGMGLATVLRQVIAMSILGSATQPLVHAKYTPLRLMSTGCCPNRFF